MKKRVYKKALHRLIKAYNSKPDKYLFRLFGFYGKNIKQDFYIWFFTNKVDYLEKDKNNIWKKVN